MDIELRNDRIPRNPFDRQFLDMISMDACTVMKREKRHNASGISNEGMQFLAMDHLCRPTIAQTPVREKKRSRSSVPFPSSAIGSDTDDRDSLTDKEVIKELRKEISTISTRTEAILALSNASKIPFGLQTLLNDTFKCCICAITPMKPPILLACTVLQNYPGVRGVRKWLVFGIGCDHEVMPSM